ncbi:MAG: GNAT family N-acetyltransferase [Planctomycetes bacterium]|nr:GNAT family N-acetyltransferase [Planctomycetota bacterium]
MTPALFDPRPTRLLGQGVVLEPLGHEHAADLLAAGGDADVWAWMPRGPFMDEADVHGWIDEALGAVEARLAVVFAIRLIEQGQPGRAVGSTRFMDIQRSDLGMEIGWTWISPEVQRSGVNTECKDLLLNHAFDDLGAERVQLKTDSLNLKSQRAMERICAEHEGVLRHHRRIELPDGSVRWRDSVYYSIIRDEWPAIKAHLARLVARQY